MSRSKKRRQQPAAAKPDHAHPAPSQSAPSQSAVTTSAPPGSRPPVDSAVTFSKAQWTWFRAVVALAALWWLALLIAAVTTANPPTLSAVMIRQADCVVRFRVTDDSEHTFLIEECFRNPLSDVQDACPPIGRVSFPLPSGLKLQPRTSYFIPLRNTGTTFEPPSRKADEAGNFTVVPVTPTSQLELQAVLKSLVPEPAPAP